MGVGVGVGYSLESPILEGMAQKGYLFWASGILWGEVYEWVERSLLSSPCDDESSVKGYIKLFFMVEAALKCQITVKVISIFPLFVEFVRP